MSFFHYKGVKLYMLAEQIPNSNAPRLQSLAHKSFVKHIVSETLPEAERPVLSHDNIEMSPALFPLLQHMDPETAQYVSKNMKKLHPDISKEIERQSLEPYLENLKNIRVKEMYRWGTESYSTEEQYELHLKQMNRTTLDEAERAGDAQTVNEIASLDPTVVDNSTIRDNTIQELLQANQQPYLARDLDTFIEHNTRPVLDRVARIIRGADADFVPLARQDYAKKQSSLRYITRNEDSQRI